MAELDFSFPAPCDSKVDLLIIAGEHSGDEHAAKLVKQAKALNPGLTVAAIGGRHLEETGAQLLFDLIQYSVIGFFEVLKNIGVYKKIIAETVAWVSKYRPKAVCFVDYPGMNLRVAKQLVEAGVARKGGGEVSLLYYISPQVWAWKAKRRFKMAELLDGLSVIFPFEVNCFTDTNLKADFVGHPFLADDYELPVSYEAGAPVLLLPGSRFGAVSRIAPDTFKAFAECLKNRPSLEAVCIYASDALKTHLEQLVEAEGSIKKRVRLVPNTQLVKASAVITSSGTMSLNCALAGLPGMIVYRTSTPTYWFAKFWLKIKYIGIANLLLDRAMYPEFLQFELKPNTLAKDLLECLDSDERIERTQTLSEELRGLLDKPASGGVGKWIVDFL